VKSNKAMTSKSGPVETVLNGWNVLVHHEIDNEKIVLEFESDVILDLNDFRKFVVTLHSYEALMDPKAVFCEAVYIERYQDGVGFFSAEWGTELLRHRGEHYVAYQHYSNRDYERKVSALVRLYERECEHSDLERRRKDNVERFLTRQIDRLEKKVSVQNEKLAAAQLEILKRTWTVFNG